MTRIRIASAVLVLTSCCLAATPTAQSTATPEAPPQARYQAPSAYPEPESAAVWRSLGASYVRKALKENQLDRDPVLNTRIDAVIRAVGAAAGRLYPGFAESAWRALLISEFGHGAVAFPGGTVLVDAAFVRRLELTDDELALMLAHEVAHLIAGHPSEKLSFMADQLGKDRAPTAGSALHAFFSQDSYAHLFKPTARLQEREADAIGAAVLLFSGYDWQRSLALFDKLAELEHGDEAAEDSTHDAASLRRRTVMRVIEALLRDSPRTSP
jgi:predicted Zn-dependent protease